MSSGELLIPVFTGKYPPAWPPQNGKAGPQEGNPNHHATYLSAEEAFRREYRTDAHFTAYTVPHITWRLCNETAPLLVEKELAPVTMSLLVFDIDGREHKASAEWKESARQRLTAFADGTFWYETRGGFRLVYRLPVPFEIRTADDAMAWRAMYATAALHLQRATGVSADLNCDDWPRFFRVPHATRSGGRPEALPRSDPATIKPWLHTPLAPRSPDDPTLDDDIALARDLEISWAHTWSHAVTSLESVRAGRSDRPPKERVAKATRAKSTRALETGPPPDNAADEELAIAMSQVRSVWVKGQIDIAGRRVANELACRGYSAERVAAIVSHAVALSGLRGDVASIRKKAYVQAERVHKLRPDALWFQCRKHYPDLYAVIVERTPPPTTEETPPPALTSAADAVAEIDRVCADALRQPGIVVIRSTTGVGKSDSIRGAVVAFGQPVSIFVQGHDVARTYEEKFAAFDVPAKRGEGVAAVLDADGARECKRLPAVEALAVVGVMPRDKLCPECPFRAGCTAAERGTAEGVVRIDQASIAHRLTSYFTGKLKVPSTDDKPVYRSIVIDEPPPLTSVHKLDDDSASAWSEMVRHYITPNARVAFDQLAHPVLAALKRVVDGVAVVRDGMSLRDLFDHCGYDAGPEHAFADAREVPARPWTGGLTAALVAPTADTAWIARVKRAVEFAELLVEAAHRPDAPLLSIDDRTGARALTVRAAWARHARAFADAGGSVLLLDATAHHEALKAAIGVHDFVSIDVADAVGVERVRVPWGSSARKHHTIGSGAKCQPNPEKLKGPLRDLANRIRDRSALDVGVIADKPTAIGLRDAIAAVEAGAPTPELVPEELAELVRKGVKFDVGWYGNQKGSNRWSNVDLFATIGDPHPHLGDARAGAVALGLEREALAEQLVDAELVQAWGRVRPVHRTKPVLVVAYTNLNPARSGMAPQWHGASFGRLAMGRPTTANPATDPATWALERSAAGVSQREHSVMVGLPRTTYQRVESKNPDLSQGREWPIIATKRKAIETAVCTAEPSETSSAHFRATADPEKDRPFWGLPTDQPEALPVEPTFTHTTEVFDAPVTNDPAELDGVQVEATDVDLVACNIPRFAEPDDVTDDQPEELEPSIANDNPRRYWWEGRAPSPPIHQPANDPPRTLPLEQLIAVSRGGGSVRGAGVRLPGSGMAACGRSEVPRRRTWWSR